MVTAWFSSGGGNNLQTILLSMRESFHVGIFKRFENDARDWNMIELDFKQKEGDYYPDPRTTRNISGKKFKLKVHLPK